jgi:UDP-N-acetyl-D-mannosaminuronic acid dehydrogenase
MSEIKHICCSEDVQLLDILCIFENSNIYHLPGGIALVVNEKGELVGTVSEGDIRRAMLNGLSLQSFAKEVMQTDPITFQDTFSIKEIIERIPWELERRNRRSRRFLGKIILKDIENRPVRVLDYHELWEQKVATHRHLVVVGLGYVGLTMAVVMADAGFLVTGVDVDEDKIKTLADGRCYIHEVGLPELVKEQIHKNLRVSQVIPNDGDVYIISVGTPVIEDVDGKKRPIMNFLHDACEKIGGKLKSGNLVVLRSTVPIGTCRKFVKAKLEEYSGLKCGLDFHLSFAPERTAEGKALKELRTLPQIIGGINRDSVEATAAIFRDLTPTIVKVESLEAAEMAKLINNSFRDYVFAYANQMAKIASQFNINVVDVIHAANEGYPRDTVPLPSPGVGGPCLTKDPHIFASVAEEYKFNNDLFLRGRQINESMHGMVHSSVMNQLILNGKDPKKCKILVCGLAFKGNPETGDIRNSSGVEIAQLFQGQVEKVYGYDPIALKSEVLEYGIEPVSFEGAFQNMDAVLFLNNHKSFEKINVFEMTRSMNEKPIVYDGWNLFRFEDVLSARPCTFMGLSFVRSSLENQSNEI